MSNVKCPANQAGRQRSKENQAGFSVIEVLLAAAIFVIFSSGIVGVVLQGFSVNRLGNEETIANQYATEGLEAARSIKNQSYSNLVNSASTGLTRSASNVWSFSGTNNIFGKYTRVLSVADMQRDASGNIVSSGGTVDPATKKITSTVSWNFSPTRNNSVVLTTYLTNWRAGIGRGGMLVYGNGGTTTDAIAYKLFDGATGTWGSAGAVSDVDSASANKAVRALKVYSSSTRDEKILITRHYNGSQQFIYTMVWNGSAWGTPTLLSSWTAATFLDVQNFDGTYLANGDFMAIYSDNTIIPKYRIWNGTSWGAQGSLTTLGTSQIPNYIIARARSGTNEVMTAFFTQGTSTITEYWSGSSWSAITTHASAAPVNTKKLVDFAWSSSNTTKGGLVFADSGADKSLDIKIWSANGSGSGSWSSLVNATAQSNNIGAVAIEGSPTASEFIACDKDDRNPPRILCYKSDFTPTWTTPTNSTIVTGSDTGIQQSSDISYEQISGDPALIVYSDNTAIPKLKKYTANTSTWDLSATNISTAPFAPGIIKAVRVIPDTTSDDVMSFFTDANLDLYSVEWDGTNNAVYTTPAGRAISQHGLNGSVTTDFWYDFVWDNL